MKRILILVATLALAACASPRTATIEDGKVTNITSAEAVTLIKQDNRRKLVNDVQDKAKPLFVLEAKPGETFTLSGVQKIEVNAPIDPALLLAEQPDAVSENVQMLREVRGIARETAVPLGLGGMALADRNSARKSATEQAEIAAEASVQMETLRSAERQSLTSQAIEAAEKPPLVLHVPLGTTAPSE